MNAIAQNLVDGLIETEQEQGAQLIFGVPPKPNTYPCSGGAQQSGKMLGAGGFRTTAAVTVVARLSVFGENPVPDREQVIQWQPTPTSDQQSLRVKNVTKIFDAVIVFECEDPNQSA